MNIHNGGGATLLGHLLTSLDTSDLNIVLLDNRFNIPIKQYSHVKIYRVFPTIFRRFLSELWLFRNVRREDCILCFGNLPPLFPLAGFTTVFVQNRYLLDRVNLINLPLRLRLRLFIERFWLLYRGSSVDQFIVQTPTMFNLMKERAKNWKGLVKMLPLSNQFEDSLLVQNISEEKLHHEVDFIYVASGEPHKNHSKLMEAWCLLADEGFFPSLWLTVSEENEPHLCTFIFEKIKAKQLHVKNLGMQAPSEIFPLYKKASALIYPSTFESFGLPLIEAKQAGIPIIASELDYVRDIVVPNQTFDPQSPVSIARAVKRFLGFKDNPLPLVDAKEFLCSVMQKSK